MTDEEISETLMKVAREDIARCTKDILEGGETLPHFLGMTGDGSMQYYLTPWSGERDKDAIVEMLRRRFAQDGTVGYALVSEVWYLLLEPGEARPPGQPYDYPHLRREALRAMVTTHKGEWSISCEITREGGVVQVADPVETDLSGFQSSGRMTGLLPVRH